MATSILHFKHF